MDDQQLINRIEAQSSMIWVRRSGAYEAFAAGTMIFDVSHNAELLEEFATELSAEFGQRIVRQANGGFRWMDLEGRRVWITYDRFRAIEKAQPELGGLEDEPIM